MSSSKRKLARNPKRKGFAFKKSSRTLKGSSAYKLRRNSRVWKAMHPGSDGWKLSPPIPGTQVGQDLYVAKLRDTAEYGDYVTYGVFASKRAARVGQRDDAVAVTVDAEGARYIEKKYGDVYKFHRLTSVRGGSSRFGA